MKLVGLILVALWLSADPGPHDTYDTLLKAHVKDGAVDYSGLKKKEKALDSYLAKLASTDLAKMERDGRLAFWINAYNAFTLKLILENHPGLKSIRDLSRPWKRRVYKAAGGTYSLDDIEHRIIRKQFKEPRIHFALVCASWSCPDLRPEAFVAGRLDAQLEEQTRAFLRDPKKGFKRRKDSVAISKLFDWYEGDFEKRDGTVLDFILPYLNRQDGDWVKANRDDLDIDYLRYDWSLNGK